MIRSPSLPHRAAFLCEARQQLPSSNASWDHSSSSKSTSLASCSTHLLSWHHLCQLPPPSWHNRLPAWRVFPDITGMLYPSSSILSRRRPGWTVSAHQSVTTRQQHSKPLKASSHLFKSFELDNNLGRNFSRPNEVSKELVNCHSSVHSMKLQSFHGIEQPVKKSPRKQVSTVNGDTPLSSLSPLQGKESIGLSDAAYANPASTQRDYEAFGHSLRPNNSSDQHFSSLDRIRNINTEIDLRNISQKRFKSADDGLDTPEVASRAGQFLSSGLNSIVQEASIHCSSLSSGDSEIPSFSLQTRDSTNANGLCQDGSVFGQTKSQFLSDNNCVSCGNGERSVISPQMAPSWFDRYGSFKNDQMVTVPAHEKSTIKSMNQSLIYGTSSDRLSSLHSLKKLNSLVEKGLLDLAPKSSTVTLKELCFTGSDLLSSSVANQSLAVIPQKRKTSAPELLSWHKELALDSQRLHCIRCLTSFDIYSLANVEWAHATNRLIEKMEDETEMMDDGQVFFRPKKRHTLTTQLIQQLFRPPPATFLSAAANLEYEGMVYLVARYASSDACVAVSTAGTKFDSTLDSKNNFCEKLKSSVEIGSQHLHKLMKDFIGRARKLENDLLRVEKRVSIIDLRVGCQDLEKFSVINRFAKFHTRGQVDGREASSSDPTAYSQKICPQRYVTAVQMPRNLPDRVQCLSL